MRRFLGSFDSKEYSHLLKDLREELFGEKRTPRKRGGVDAGKLSIEDRLTVNMAEHAGLVWRKTGRLTPLAELQHA